MALDNKKLIRVWITTLIIVVIIGIIVYPKIKQTVKLRSELNKNMPASKSYNFV